MLEIVVGMDPYLQQAIAHLKKICPHVDDGDPIANLERLRKVMEVWDTDGGGMPDDVWDDLTAYVASIPDLLPSNPIIEELLSAAPPGQFDFPFNLNAPRAAGGALVQAIRQCPSQCVDNYEPELIQLRACDTRADAVEALKRDGIALVADMDMDCGKAAEACRAQKNYFPIFAGHVYFSDEANVQDLMKRFNRSKGVESTHRLVFSYVSRIRDGHPKLRCQLLCENASAKLYDSRRTQAEEEYNARTWDRVLPIAETLKRHVLSRFQLGTAVAHVSALRTTRAGVNQRRHVDTPKHTIYSVICNFEGTARIRYWQSSHVITTFVSHLWFRWLSGGQRVPATFFPSELVEPCTAQSRKQLYFFYLACVCARHFGFEPRMFPYREVIIPVGSYIVFNSTMWHLGAADQPGDVLASERMHLYLSSIQEEDIASAPVRTVGQEIDPDSVKGPKRGERPVMPQPWLSACQAFLHAEKYLDMDHFPNLEWDMANLRAYAKPG